MKKQNLIKLLILVIAISFCTFYFVFYEVHNTLAASIDASASNPRSGSNVPSGAEIRINVEFQTSDLEFITYVENIGDPDKRGLYPAIEILNSENIEIISANEKCQISRNNSTITCDKSLIKLSTLGEISTYQNFFVFKFKSDINTQTGSQTSVSLRILVKKAYNNEVLAQEALEFYLNNSGYECNLINVNDPQSSRNVNTGELTCQDAINCFPPGAAIRCQDRCQPPFERLYLTNPDCPPEKQICCVKKAPQYSQLGCSVVYNSQNFPFEGECRTFCSGDKPYVITRPDATCPATNGYPMLCCSPYNYFTNRNNIPSVCAFGVNPDGTEKLGIKVPFGNGCIPVLDNINEAFTHILAWSAGILGLISLLLLIYSGFLIMTSKGNPEKFQSGKELLASTVISLTFFTFSVFVLRIIISDILGLID